MKIAFISGGYPAPNAPQIAVFLQETAFSLARLGHECVIISPVSIFRFSALGLTEKIYNEERDGVTIEIRRPLFFSASSQKIGSFNTYKITQKAFEMAVAGEMAKLKKKPDLLYGIFMYPGGKTAVTMGEIFNIKSVVEVGEGEFWSIVPYGPKRAGREIGGASLINALGSHLARRLKEELNIAPEKIFVEPNGVDRKLFRPLDKNMCRRKLSLPPNSFIALFVGTFNENKGAKKVLKAVENIPDLQLVMIGRGEENIHSEKLLFKGIVSHETLPLWYGAADLFVLPTKVEGSCNAILEAMSSGLPIVTSLGEHLDDLVTDECAIRINPDAPEEISAAICKIKDNPELRAKLSAAAYKRSALFDSVSHAERLSRRFLELTGLEA